MTKRGISPEWWISLVPAIWLMAILMGCAGGGEYRNTDPDQPWNSPGEADDITQPWHDPAYRDDPMAPWNQWHPNETLEEYEERTGLR